jgi:hypothetical protein
MGKVDQTMFLLRQGRDILIVQVYVDDIVFAGSSNSLVARFAEDVSREFEMSMMGELQFFLGLQIKQSKEGTFVHQAKYTKDIVWKFKMEDSKAMVTPMSTTTTLDADEEGEHVDQKEYQSMIESLLYLTATRPDIEFSVCLCARFQASPRTSHRQEEKQIFRYLRHTPDFGLWYSTSTSLALHGFSDVDFSWCRLDRKSTSGTCQFLGSSLVSWSSRKQSSVAQSTTEAEYVAAASCCPQLLWISYTMSDFGEEYTEGPIRQTREGGSEWEPIKILLEGDENSNKMNTASNTRLRHTTKVGQAHVATGVPLDPRNAAEKPNLEPTDLHRSDR